MGVVFNSLFPSAFKGAPFFYISGDVASGRKTVNHEYPNKDFRFVEDLGRELRIFTVRGIIKGLAYELEKLALENALNSGTPGILLHPFEGIINVTSTTFTVTESLSQVGIAEYNMTFLETSSSIFPNANNDNTSRIAQFFNDIYKDAGDEFNANYSVGTNRNITSAADKLNSLNNNLQASASTVSSEQDNRTDFLTNSERFTDNAVGIANGDTGNEISELISNFDAVASEPIDRLDASSQIIGFGESDEFLDIDTTEINQRNTNTKLINGLANGLALVNMIDAAKNIEYNDEDQLNGIANEIDAAFTRIEEADSNIFSPDFFDNINLIRNELRLFFDRERLVVNKIVEVETKPTPMTVLAYSYYGDTDEYESLIELNNVTDPTIVSGKIKILET